jgi:AcrR family transcriptional regulator
MAKTSTKAAPGEKTRLTRDDWIEAASRVLREESVDAVRIKRLAELLDATRGSFYWHFKDRTDLLNEVLAAWRLRQNNRIIARLKEELSLTPMQRVIGLRNTAKQTKRSAEAAQLELSVRSWARHDRSAREVVIDVDRERIAIAETFLCDTGMPKDLAVTWAFVGYAFTVGSSMLDPELVTDKMESSRKLLMDAQFPSSTPSSNFTLEEKQ